MADAAAAKAAAASSSASLPAADDDASGDADDSLCDYVSGLAHVVAPTCVGCGQSLAHAHERGKWCMGYCCVRQVCGVVVVLCNWFQQAPAKQRLGVLVVALAVLFVGWWYTSSEVNQVLSPAVDATIQSLADDMDVASASGAGAGSVVGQ